MKDPIVKERKVNKIKTLHKPNSTLPPFPGASDLPQSNLLCLDSSNREDLKNINHAVKCPFVV